jgi:hypothetical protein
MNALMAVLLLQQAAAIDPQLAAQYFSEAKVISERDAGKLWGRPVYAPMIFVEPNSRYAVANVADREGRLRQQGSVYVGALPENFIVANTATRWSGTHWTMIKWPLPENRYTRRRLLVHELFHRMQDSLGLPGSDVANGHLAFGDGRVLMRLEWRALAEALMRDGEERRTAIADALLFRGRRRELFERARVEERQLELNEGLAEYTGFKLSGLPAAVLPDRAAVHLNNYDVMENFARAFAYASGPAYGLLLDAAGVPWRKSLKADSDLGELLRAAYRITPSRTAQLEARISVYDAQRMVSEEKARVAERMAAQQQLRARLVDGPTLTFPVLSEFSYGFDPNAAIPLEGFGTAYRNLRVTDEWGTLTVEGGGALLLRNERGVTGVVIAAPTSSASPLSGDGWKLVLRDGWEVVADQKPGSFRIAKQ